MKILLLTDAYPFGKNETFVHNEMIELSKYVDTIEIQPLFRRANLMYDNIPKNVMVNNPFWAGSGVLEFFKKSIFNCSSFFKFFQFFNRDYLKNYSSFLNYLKAVFLLRSLSAEKAFLNKLSDPSYDVVYFYWGVNFAYIIPFFKIASKTLVRFHSYDLFENRGMKIAFQKEIIEKMDKGIFISYNGLETMSKCYPKSAHKFEISLLGVYDRGLSRPSTDGIFRIVSCSNLVQVKRVHLIPKALDLIKEQVEWVHFGIGPLEDQVRKSIAEVRNPFIYQELMGYIENKNLMKFYSENPVDLFLNVSTAEGIPVSIMEAFSFGIPVIATNVGGSGELVNESTGHLLPIDFEPHQLADAIKAMINDKKAQSGRRSQARGEWQKKVKAEENYKKFFEILVKLENSNN